MIARLRGLLLVTLWFSAIAVLAPFMITLVLITRNENFIYKPVRVFVRLGLKLVGVRVEVKGLENLDPNETYVITPNHQSFIEVPLLLTYLGLNPGYLAKKEVFRYPLFGYGIGLMGVVPIDRSNSRVAVLGAQAATENLRSGKSYVVYPEGTRSRDGQLLPFKKGAFLMAIQAGVPVVPLTLSGCTVIMPKQSFKVLPGTIRITVHAPIPTTGVDPDNVRELMDRVRGDILSTLEIPESAGH